MQMSNVIRKRIKITTQTVFEKIYIIVCLTFSVSRVEYYITKCDAHTRQLFVVHTNRLVGVTQSAV